MVPAVLNRLNPQVCRHKTGKIQKKAGMDMQFAVVLNGEIIAFCGVCTYIFKIHSEFSVRE